MCCFCIASLRHSRMGRESLFNVALNSSQYFPSYSARTRMATTFEFKACSVLSHLIGCTDLSSYALFLNKCIVVFYFHYVSGTCSIYFSCSRISQSSLSQYCSFLSSPPPTADLHCAADTGGAGVGGRGNQHQEGPALHRLKGPDREHPAPAPAPLPQN